MLDVIVIGGGPAGLSAALVLGRARRQVLLCDGGESGAAVEAEVRGFFTRDGVSRAWLREIGAAQLGGYKTVRVCQGRVLDARRSGADGWEVRTQAGELHQARRLLLATGLTHELAGIEGAQALWGTAVFHCPFCHGFETVGKRVAVLGGSPDRARIALQLSRFTGEVVLCSNGPADLDGATLAALKTADVAVRSERVIRLSRDALRAVVEFESGPSESRDAVFAPFGLRPRDGLARRIGCAAWPDGTLRVDGFGRTSVAGVYAAGEMARPPGVPFPLTTVATSAAGGTVAASVLDQDLLTADFGLPDPFAEARDA